MLGTRLRMSSGGILIPAGLIVPFTGSSIPANWSRFTLADNRMIVGAGSTYSPLSTGGGGNVSISTTSSTIGNHLGTSFNGESNITSSPNAGGPTSSGGHSHTITGTGFQTDLYQNYILIKAQQQTSLIPNGGRLLSHLDLSTNLNNVDNTINRFLMSNATAGGTGGSASISINCTTNTVGDHSHGNTGFGGLSAGGIPYGTFAAGSHSHVITMLGTLATKQKYLACWNKAAQAFSLVKNGIGMWESLSIPTGWGLCDGTQGTPDMRDFFLRIGDLSTMNTSSGNNQVTFSGTTDIKSHNHAAGTSSAAATNWHINSISHSHTASQVLSAIQSYCALSFIMKL